MDRDRSMASRFALKMTKSDLPFLNSDDIEKLIAKEKEKCSGYQSLMNIGLYLLQLKLVSALKKLLDLVTSGQSLEAIMLQLSKIALLYKVIDSKSKKSKSKAILDAQLQAEIEKNDKWLIAAMNQYYTRRHDKTAYGKQKNKKPVFLKEVAKRQKKIVKAFLAQAQKVKAELLERIFSRKPTELLFQRNLKRIFQNPNTPYSSKIISLPKSRLQSRVCEEQKVHGINHKVG